MFSCTIPATDGIQIDIHVFSFIPGRYAVELFVFNLDKWTIPPRRYDFVDGAGSPHRYRVVVSCLIIYDVPCTDAYVYFIHYGNNQDIRRLTCPIPSTRKYYFVVRGVVSCVFEPINSAGHSPYDDFFLLSTINKNELAIYFSCIVTNCMSRRNMVWGKGRRR